MEYLLDLWRPLVEISILWFVLYMLFRFIQGTRAVQVLMGLLILAVVFNVARIFGLDTINWFLTKLFAIGIIAFLIIFQPELRRALARLGKTTVFSTFLKEGGSVDEIVKACGSLSKNKIGALFAIERDVGLKNYIESGTLVDAQIVSELLTTIFYPGTALHDGGVVVQGNRITSCGSLFPLTQNINVSRTLGTRHRAALGLTEETDAVCIVVSEETGGISVAVAGQLKSDLGVDGLRKELIDIFVQAERKNVLMDLWKDFRSGKVADK